MFFLSRNLSLEFILLITFRAIDSPDIVSSNIQPKYVTFECCFICIFLYLIFSFGTLFILRLEAKSIDLVLSSPKWMLSLLSTNHSQMFVKSSFNCFSISITFFPWKTRQGSSAYRNRFYLTACGMSFTYTRNSNGPRMDPCATPHGILEGSE